MDLGISSLQLDAWERGFSYSYDAPLDMRMDPDQELSALEVVNEWPERRIADAIRDYGEERHARRVAREIVAAGRCATTSELVEAIRAALPPEARFGRGHPAKRTFQGIRIAVNCGARGARPRAARRVGAAAPRRAPRRDLLPLARGPARQALPRRARDRVRLPAGASGLRLRPHPRGGAADAAAPIAPTPEEADDESALALGAPARRGQARLGARPDGRAAAPARASVATRPREPSRPSPHDRAPPVRQARAAARRRARQRGARPPG